MSETKGRQASGKKDPVRVHDWLLVIGAVGCDWYYAFEWFYGRYSFLSGAVLRELILILVLCACLAVAIGRRRWRVTMQVFFVASYALAGFMYIGSQRHRL